MLFRDNRLQVAFALFWLWILAIWQAVDKPLAFVSPLLAILIVAIFDLGITWIRDRKIYFPSASFVSGFLIGLIIAPTEKIWVILAAALLTSFSKQFLRIGPRQHIFNPAAFGIMATSLVFGVPVAWWGVAASKWPIMILVPLMVWILWRMKRIFLPVTFLLVYLVYLLIEFGPKDAVRTLIDGSVMLFAFVLLPEPMTSPASGYFKYTLGTLVAIVSILLALIKLTGDIFLPALLTANLTGFLIARYRIFAKTPSAK